MSVLLSLTPLSNPEEVPGTGSVSTRQLAIMALDVKSRSKRYEKLDFLGEGQVRTHNKHQNILAGYRSCPVSWMFVEDV